MTRSEINATSAYLTETLQKIRSVGLNATMFAHVREQVESSNGFRDAPAHVRDEILSALEARRLQIAKLSSAI